MTNFLLVSVDRMVEVLSASLVERHGKDNQKSLVALINSLGSGR